LLLRRGDQYPLEIWIKEESLKTEFWGSKLRFFNQKHCLNEERRVKRISK